MQEHSVDSDLAGFDDHTCQSEDCLATSARLASLVVTAVTVLVTVWVLLAGGNLLLQDVSAGPYPLRARAVEYGACEHGEAALATAAEKAKSSNVGFMVSRDVRKLQS